MVLAEQFRLAAIVRDLSAEQFEAWAECGRRMVAGMPHAEAEALMWRELAAERSAI